VDGVELIAEGKSQIEEVKPSMQATPPKSEAFTSAI
jgi:hypothetical protein